MKLDRFYRLFFLVAGLILALSCIVLAEDEILSKYNYIPGEKPVAVEDFSTTQLGEIPTGPFKISGDAEVVLLNNERWLKLGSGAEITIEVPKANDLTLELFLREQESDGPVFRMFLDNQDREYSSILDAGRESIYYEGMLGSKVLAGNSVEKNFYQENSQVVQYALTLQAERAKLYINKNLAMNAAGFSPIMPNLITIRFGEGKYMIKEIRLATIVPDIAAELLIKGKYVSHGIHFDTGSAKLKEESYSVLKQVANVLTGNPDLKLRIDGHTDSTGSGAANLKLALERAESVRQYLISRFGIDGSRLTTRGAGSAEPVADNQTLLGRSQNRRVEFIKLSK